MLGGDGSTHCFKCSIARSAQGCAQSSPPLSAQCRIEVDEMGLPLRFRSDNRRRNMWMNPEKDTPIRFVPACLASGSLRGGVYYKKKISARCPPKGDSILISRIATASSASEEREARASHRQMVNNDNERNGGMLHTWLALIGLTTSYSRSD
jgi:hypothetical protein